MTMTPRAAARHRSGMIKSIFIEGVVHNRCHAPDVRETSEQINTDEKRICRIWKDLYDFSA